MAITKFAYISPTATPTRAYAKNRLQFWFFCCQFLLFTDVRDSKLVVKFGFPYSHTACLRPHNLVHVPTPAYAPKGNAYIHNDQCQPPDKSFCLTNYFTSSDPHHDMLGGGCQVRVVIENMMGRMENLRTLISGFLGLVILVRWALVTMFLS